ncbi:DUF2515 family protein [Bacillaceae bacterium Marseille-Q3522]|nr:DUF2515 family protein [Bacillaceae bacterium Marseille-Q3522]
MYHSVPLPRYLLKIKKEMQQICNNKPSAEKILPMENRLLQRIRDETREKNRNNVTRTAAYLDFYRWYPEIHWAFLGHMVSRNGGWNMTDLKGELLSRLLSEYEINSYFDFLERGNWLIFQDIYPQFLLYEESVKRGRNLFYLLPHLHVSVFMETIWNHFWTEKNSYLLTVALIINEQSFLEKNVLVHSSFQSEVFHTVPFKLQDFLALNQILFPYEENGEINLTGQTMHQFEKLHERILLGKRLYKILFQDQKRRKIIEKWALATPHSASRKDYWPQLFHDIREGVPHRIWNPRLKDCKLKLGTTRFYSPRLEHAWKDCDHLPAETKDWFCDWRVVYYLADTKEKIDGEIKDDYCKTLEKLELAAAAKKAVSFWK